MGWSSQMYWLARASSWATCSGVSSDIQINGDHVAAHVEAHIVTAVRLWAMPETMCSPE